MKNAQVIIPQVLSGIAVATAASDLKLDCRKLVTVQGEHQHKLTTKIATYGQSPPKRTAIRKPPVLPVVPSQLLGNSDTMESMYNSRGCQAGLQ